MSTSILSQSDQTVNQNPSEAVNRRRKKYDQKGYSRTHPQYLHFKPAAGVSGFKLSKAVTNIPTSYFSTADGASPEIQSRMLRVLCDRYPNIYASVRDHAQKANLSMRSAQRGLRALERAGFISRVAVPGDCGWSPRQYRVDTCRVLEAGRPKMLRGDSLSGVSRQEVVTITTGSRDYHDSMSCHSRQPDIQTEKLKEKEREKEQTTTTNAPLAPHGGIADDVVEPPHFSSDKAASPPAARVKPVTVGERAGEGQREPAAGYARTSPAKATRKPKDKGPVAGFDCGEFMADVRAVFAKSYFQSKDTQKHRDAAAALARQFGSENFCKALMLWLDWMENAAIEERPIFLGREPDDKGRQVPKYKTYILKEFIDSGAAHEYIRKAQAYFGLSMDALQTCAAHHIFEREPKYSGWNIDPAVLTPARVAALNCLLDDKCPHPIYFNSAFSEKRLEIDDLTCDWQKFGDALVRAEELCTEDLAESHCRFKKESLPELQKRRPDDPQFFLENVEKRYQEDLKKLKSFFAETYEPIRQRLLQEQAANSGQIETSAHAVSGDTELLAATPAGGVQ